MDTLEARILNPTFRDEFLGSSKVSGSVMHAPSVDINLCAFGNMFSVQDYAAKCVDYSLHPIKS